MFDSSELEDEWKIRLSRELGVAARERAKHDGITLTELTRKALECDDLNETTDTVRPGRRPKNTDGREQLGDEWKIKLPYAIGKMARERASEEGISLSCSRGVRSADIYVNGILRNSRCFKHVTMSHA